MIRIIFLLFLFSSSVYSEEINGLFGIELGEVFSKELKDENSKSNNDFFNLNYIKTISEISELDKLKKKSFDISSTIKPRILNSSYNNYSANISPLSKKILSITAYGKGMENKELCKDFFKSYTEFFNDKYIKTYPSMLISHGISLDILIISFVRNDDNKSSLLMNISCNKKLISITLINPPLLKKIKNEDVAIIEKTIVEQRKKLTNTDTSGL